MFASTAEIAIFGGCEIRCDVEKDFERNGCYSRSGLIAVAGVLGDGDGKGVGDDVAGVDLITRVHFAIKIKSSMGIGIVDRIDISLTPL